MLRDCMIGDSGPSGSGILVNRATDSAVSRTLLINCIGFLMAAIANGPMPLMASSAVLATQPALLRITACMKPRVSSSTGSGASGIGPRSLPSAVKSSSARPN